MPLCPFHRRAFLIDTVTTTEHPLTTGLIAGTRVRTAGTFEGGRRRRARGHVEIFHVEFGRLVLDTLVVDDKVIGDRQLVVRVPTQ